MLFSAWQAIDAGVAADAGVEVDDHAPRGPLGLVVLRVKLRRDVAGLVILVAGLLALRHVLVDADLLHEGRVGLIFFERRLAHESAAFHGIVLLRDGERIGLVDLLHLDAGDEAGRGRGAQRVGVDAGAVGDAQRRGDDSCARPWSGAARCGPSRARATSVWSCWPGATSTGISRLRPSGVVSFTIGIRRVRIDRDGRVGRARRMKSVSGRSELLSFTVPTFTPSLVAVFGLMSSALSQVSFVTGSGISWSQPLLA